MITHRLPLFLIGWAAAALLLGVLYLWQRRTRDATAVDAGWAGAVAGLAVLYGILGPGDAAHRIAIAIMGGVENLRLAAVVVARIGNGEDSRYRDLRARWAAKGREQLTFATFYQAQAAVAVVLSIPFLLATFDRHHGLQPLAWLGVGIWIVAAAGEALADRQLAQFKANPANKGKTMRYGLWSLSRHPNYFFQTLTWFAYGLVAVSAPWGWLGFSSYLIILFLVLFVTGIPPAEAASLRSRGDDYRRYQTETNAFIPWFPRRKSTPS